MEEKVLKQHGGKREGAGRKKVVPEGASVHSFMLTDDETVAVKRFIGSVRHKKAEAEQEKKVGMSIDEVVRLGYKMLKPVAELVIQAKGSGREAERVMKDIAIMAFKDVICEQEQRK